MRLRNRNLLVDRIEYAEISEREVARRAGLSHSTVNHLLTGRRHTCSLSTALAIERVLDSAPGTLFAADSVDERSLLTDYARSVRLTRRR